MLYAVSPEHAEADLTKPREFVETGSGGGAAENRRPLSQRRPAARDPLLPLAL